MASKRRKRNEPAPGWAWMLFGLSLGLSVALVIYLRNGAPTEPRSIRVAATAPASTPVLPATAAAADDEETASAADDGAGEAPESERLHFYTELRDLEVVVPEGEFDFDAAAGTPGEILIQAGSFPEIRGADARQAELALIGLEAQIEPARVDGKNYYRVVIGPMAATERGQINRVLRLLRERGIDGFPRGVSR